ncbi:hypothetical protein ACFL0V_04520 [Nanoarchaeota archaeon]
MDTETIIVFAVVFLVLFFVGGIIGIVALPEFPGRFFISGFLISVFGTGAGSLILKATFGK